MGFVAAFFLSILFAYLLWEHWPRRGAALYAHRWSKWDASCRARGMSADEETMEMQFRYAWATMQRKASEATLAGPTAYRQHIATAAAASAGALLHYDRRVAKKFLAVVEQSALSDILKPDALRAAMASIPVYETEITADHIAALTNR